MNPSSNLNKIPWHKFLGKILKEWLTPVNIQVQTEVPLLTDPPKADVLLLRHEEDFWTPAQFERLPDGIRQSQARVILIEFKYSESVNESALAQILGYDNTYLRAQRLKRKNLRSFLISSRSPQPSVLKRLHYHETEYPGVYCSPDSLLQPIQLIDLNLLADQPWNAPIQCFASQKASQEQAFHLLEDPSKDISADLFSVLITLSKLLLNPSGGFMKQQRWEDFTPEVAIELGRKWASMLIKTLPPEEVLEHYKPKERLQGLDAKERLQGLDTKKILETLNAEEIQQYLDSLKLKEN
ncbi:hypothetical protein WDW89_15150 [Deltaproteobacteria bacterium TL4]